MKQRTMDQSGVSAPVLLEFSMADMQVMGCHVVAYRQRQPAGQKCDAEICLVIDGGIYLMAIGTNGLEGANGRDLHYVVHAQGTQPTLESTRELSALIGKDWGTEIIQVRGLAAAVVKASKVGHQTLKLELWPSFQKIQIKTSPLPPGSKRTGTSNSRL